MTRRPTTSARTPRTTPRATRPSLPGRRKQQPQSNAQKIFGAMTKALPSAAAAKKAKPTGKGKNVALLGIAGGLAAAIKNRDKLRGKKTAEPVVHEPAVAAPEAVYTAPATTPPVTP